MSGKGIKEDEGIFLRTLMESIIGRTYVVGRTELKAQHLEFVTMCQLLPLL